MDKERFGPDGSSSLKNGRVFRRPIIVASLDNLTRRVGLKRVNEIVEKLMLVHEINEDLQQKILSRDNPQEDKDQ